MGGCQAPYRLKVRTPGAIVSFSLSLFFREQGPWLWIGWLICLGGKFQLTRSLGPA